MTAAILESPTDTRSKSATPATRPSRPVLEAVRRDSNLSGGGSRNGAISSRARTRARTPGRDTSLQPAIGDDGDPSRLVRARVPPHSRFVTKAATWKRTPGPSRLAATANCACVLSAARNTYTRTERRRAPCMRVRPYLRIRGVYSHRERGC